MLIIAYYQFHTTMPMVFMHLKEKQEETWKIIC